VQSLIPPDLFHVRAAEGWLELGCHLEANYELERISPPLRSHPDVLDLRWQIYAKEGKWEECVEIARALMRGDPERPSGWIHHSVSLHVLHRTEEAYSHLSTVVDKFSGIWTIPYNLACYCAQLGRCDEAKEWFKKAILIDDKAVPKAGIDDPDLKPLWDSMCTTVWKKES